MLGVPNQIKTNNGTGYYSQTFEMFCEKFNVTRITGIFCNSQGQGIVELYNNIFL
jgi:transposase InsO family protein